MYEICTFCGNHPYEYVDIGVGFQKVAINCCELGVALFYGNKIAKQIYEFRKSPSPRKKARARRLMTEFYPEMVDHRKKYHPKT